MKESYVLITGASSGIGRSVAMSLSASKRLILHGRNVHRLEDLFSSISSPDLHRTWVCDLSCVDDITQQIQRLNSTYDINVSAIVHCAGVVCIDSIRKQTPARSIDIFSPNVFSIALIVSALSSYGHSISDIVIISSTASVLGETGVAAYSGSKGAVNSLVKQLAYELASEGVRVNAILPSLVRTPMTESIFSNEESIKGIISKYPLGLLEPTAISDVVSFLLSSPAVWLTGQQIVVDGGRTVI